MIVVLPRLDVKVTIGNFNATLGREDVIHVTNNTGHKPINLAAKRQT